MDAHLKNNEKFAEDLLAKLGILGQSPVKQEFWEKLETGFVESEKHVQNAKDRRFMTNLVARLKYKAEEHGDYSSENVFLVRRMVEGFGFEIFVNGGQEGLFSQICKGSGESN